MSARFLPGDIPPRPPRDDSRVLRIGPDPDPAAVRACHLCVAGRWITCIYREWRPEDEGRCRRCDVCTAYEGACLLQVAEFVPRDAVADFAARGRPRQAPPGPELESATGVERLRLKETT